MKAQEHPPVNHSQRCDLTPPGSIGESTPASNLCGAELQGPAGLEDAPEAPWTRHSPRSKRPK